MSSRLVAAVSDRQQQYQQIPSSPHDVEPTYQGAYGPDGPPSDRVIRPIQPSFHHHPPRGLHVDTTRGLGTPQGLYSPGGTYRPAPHGASSPSPPPSYSDGGHEPSHLVAPPMAAFVQPKSPVSPGEGGVAFSAIKGGQGDGVMWGEGVQEKAARGFRGDEEPPAFWKRMSGMAKNRQSSAWLKKQSGKSDRFRYTTWAITILVLVAIAGAIFLYITHKSANSNASPSTLNWANGVASTEVPNVFTSQLSQTTSAGAATGSSTGSSSKMRRHYGLEPTGVINGHGRY